MDKIKSALADLGIIESAQKIYISLLRDGDASARLLSERTGITRPSVYDQAKELKTKGLITERDINGKTYFSASDIKYLDRLLEEKIENLQAGRETFKQAILSLANKQSAAPKIKFFDGSDGARQMLKDILWHDEITLLIFWPYQEMLEMLGPEFLKWFNERRARRGIKIKTIWPYNEIKKGRHIFTDDKDDVTRKYAKQEQKFSMGYLIYENKTAFISSARESFGFIVESNEFADLMRMQFESLFAGAKSAKK